MRGVAAAGSNHDPPQAPAEGVSMPLNLVELTDVEVRSSLA